MSGWANALMPARLGTQPFLSRPRPARLRPGRQLVEDQLVRALGPLTEHRARVARIDDVLDREVLGGPEGGEDCAQAGLDLGAQGGGILGRLELALERGLQPAGDWQRAPVPRRPRVAQVQPRTAAVPGAGDPVDLANEDRAPRDGRLV